MRPVILSILLIATANAQDYSSIPWLERWETSDSLFHLGMAILREEGPDSALVLFSEALNQHPSNYKVYEHRWAIFRYKFDRGIISSDAVVTIIQGDIQELNKHDFNDDQVFIKNRELEHLFFTTKDQSYQNQRRTLLKDFVQAYPDNRRIPRSYLILGELAENPTKALEYYRTIVKKTTHKLANADAFHEIAKISFHHPELVSDEELETNFASWEQIVQDYIPEKQPYVAVNFYYRIARYELERQDNTVQAQYWLDKMADLQQKRNLGSQAKLPIQFLKGEVALEQGKKEEAKRQYRSGLALFGQIKEIPPSEDTLEGMRSRFRELLTSFYSF